MCKKLWNQSFERFEEAREKITKKNLYYSFLFFNKENPNLYKKGKVSH